MKRELVKWNLQDELERHVSNRVAQLQSEYLSPARKSTGARKLAALRRAVSEEPGATPEIWGIIFDGLPDCFLGQAYEPSPGEYAVHGALTLYAVHQQSQVVGMHERGRDHSLGAAVRMLVNRNANKYASLKDGELPRRFAAMITASSMQETMHYARQLVQLMRASSVSLDYGLFAKQLYLLQDPEYADGIRLSWGRDYARFRPHETNETEVGK